MAELGALSLRIEENGGSAVLTKLKQIDNAARVTSQSATPLSAYFKQAEAGAHRHGAAMSKAQLAQAALNKEIAEGTRLFAVQARTVDITSDVAIAELRASAAAQREWLVAIGASTEQQQRFNAATMVLDARMGRAGMQMQHAASRTRSAGSAVAALAIAASVGGGSLREMANSAGLLASVMAFEFAPLKWQGYAAGIGVAVIALTAFVGILKKLNEEAQKPREAITGRIAAINITSIAKQEADRLRTERDALDKFILEAKRVGFISTMGAGEQKRPIAPPAFEGIGPTPKSVREAENRQKQLAAEFAIANKRLAELTNQGIKDSAEVAKQAIVTAAEATKTVRLSELAKEQAAVEAKFAEGTASLAEQYAARKKAIVEGAKAERAEMEAQRAALLKVLPGEDPKGAAVQGRRQEAAAISSDIAALANETAARLTALDTQRAADESTLAAKVLGYRQQLEAFDDTAFTKRMQQIDAEDAERRRTLAQRGNATAQEIADLDALTEKQKAQLFLQKAQADLARLREDLALRLQEVENRRLAGLITEEQASREIVDITRSASPELLKAVNRAIEWAEKLGEQGVLGALKAIRAELSTPVLLNIDIDSDAITRRLNEALDKIRNAVNSGVLDAEAGRRAVNQQQFAAGFASAVSDSLATGAVAALQGKNPLQALAQSLSSALGSLMVDFGKKALASSVIMQNLQNALATMNPWAAAAIAASLIVFGTAIGGRSGGVGSVGGGFSGGSTTSSTPLSVSRLIVDPNAGVRQRIASAGMQGAAGPSAPVQVIEVIGHTTPRGQEMIGVANARYTRRGG